MPAVARAVEFDFGHAHFERKESLELLMAKLQRFAPASDRNEFSRLFKDATVLLELEDAELAGMFKVSRPTIGRWARAESAPHPLGREPVFKSLMRVAQSKLRIADKALHSSFYA